MRGSKREVTSLVLHGGVPTFPHAFGTLLLLELQNVQLGEQHCSGKDGSLAQKYPVALLPSSPQLLLKEGGDKFSPTCSCPAVSYLAGTWGGQEGPPGLDPRGALGSGCRTAPC